MDLISVEGGTTWFEGALDTETLLLEYWVT